MILAHLSDTHITPPGTLLYNHVDTASALRQAIRRLQALQPRPDAVIITGDLVNAGSPAEYVLLREILGELSQPLLLLPGNHDQRNHLRQMFPAQTVPLQEERMNGRVLLAGLPILCLDTVVPGSDGGVLTPTTLAWLDRCLAEHPQPCIVAMHHPPFATGIAGMDQIGCNGADLADCLTRHPHVLAVICGHVHRFVVGRIDSRPAIIAPSPAHQIQLKLDGSPDDLAYTLEPGGFLLHHLRGEQWTTHYCPIHPQPVFRYQ